MKIINLPANINANRALLGLALLMSTVAFILSVLLISCPKPFYLVNFQYNPSSGVNKVISSTSKIIGAFDDLFSSRSDDRKHAPEPNLSSVRVSIGSVCVQANKSTQALECETSARKLEGRFKDPLDIIKVAGFFKEKLTFPLSWWVGIGALGVTVLCMVTINIPLISVPPILPRVALVFAIISSVSLMGGSMILHFTTEIVVALSTRLTMGTIQAQAGNASRALAWASFALSAVVTIATALASFIDTAINNNTEDQMSINELVRPESNVEGEESYPLTPIPTYYQPRRTRTNANNIVNNPNTHFEAQLSSNVPSPLYQRRRMRKDNNNSSSNNDNNNNRLDTILEDNSPRFENNLPDLPNPIYQQHLLQPSYYQQRGR